MIRGTWNEGRRPDVEKEKLHPWMKAIKERKKEETRGMEEAEKEPQPMGSIILGYCSYPISPISAFLSRSTVNHQQEGV